MTMAASTFRAAYSNARAAKVRTPRTPIAVRLGRALARITPKWETLRRATLSVTGLGAISYGIWMITPAAGIIAGGLSLLLIDLAAGGDT